MGSSISSTQVYKNISYQIIQPLVYLLFGLAILYFIYGAIRFIYSLGKGDLEGKKNGQEHLKYGIIGLAIMLSVFGIMNVIYDVLNSGSSTDLQGHPLNRPPEIDHF